MDLLLTGDKKIDTAIINLYKQIEKLQSEEKLKQYVYGETYNGVKIIFAETITVYRGVFVPYQTIDGASRMILNMTIQTGVTSNIDISLSGIKWKTGYLLDGTPGEDLQSLSCLANSGTSYAHTYQVNRILAGTSGNATAWSISGDVELESKPTWAD